MKRRDFVTRLGAVGAAVGSGMLLPAKQAGAQPSPPNPDPANIEPLGRGFRVLPTGGDDRENLEWALSNTSSGGTVRLVAGTYKLGGTAIVPDFDGKLVGAGAGKTTVTCTDEYNYELWEAPGGGRDQGLPKPPPFPRRPVNGTTTKAAPGLILFYKTPLAPGEDPADRANRIELRDLRCRGAMIGSPWTFGDEVLCFTVINSIDWDNVEAAPETTRQDVLVSGIEVDGYKTDEFPVFGNACACITVTGGLILTDNYDFTGATDGDAFGAENGALLGLTPAEGDVTFRNCTFRNCRVGPGVLGCKDSNVLFDGITTDGCRGNCLQIFDNSGCNIEVRNCDLFCDSFLLPKELTPGGLFDDIPSALGCVVAFQASAAIVGIPSNLRWLDLALDEAAHDVWGPAAGPLGTWRPLGPAAVGEPCTVTIADTRCESPGTPNSYCFHLIDGANAGFQIPSLTAIIRDNECTGGQTCVGIEFASDCQVTNNKCDSLQTGVELHNAFNAEVGDNKFKFANEGGCEVLSLFGVDQKTDFYRVVPGAGTCSAQG